MHCVRTLLISCSLLLAACFNFGHLNRDQSSRPDVRVGTRATILLPSDTHAAAGSISGGGTQQREETQNQSSGSSSGSGSGSSSEEIPVLAGSGGSSDSSTRTRDVPILGPITAIFGYPFSIFGKSASEKADEAAAERETEISAPRFPRTSDQEERDRLEAENRRIREQLAQRAEQSPAVGGSIAEELAALERTLRREPGSLSVERREAFDRDLDGRPDLWSVRSGDELREELDEDRDGRPDRVLRYDAAGMLVRAEEDLDRNGSFETVSQYAQGEIARRRADSDGDGQSDSWTFYRAGEMIRHEVDRDRDGFRDLVLVYAEGELEREEDDRNRDGRPDLITRYRDGAVQEKHEDVDFDGRTDVSSFYEDGKLVRRSVNQSSSLEGWDEGS